MTERVLIFNGQLVSPAPADLTMRAILGPDSPSRVAGTWQLAPATGHVTVGVTFYDSTMRRMSKWEQSCACGSAGAIQIGDGAAPTCGGCGAGLRRVGDDLDA